MASGPMTRSRARLLAAAPVDRGLYPFTRSRSIRVGLDNLALYRYSPYTVERTARTGVVRRPRVRRHDGGLPAFAADGGFMGDDGGPMPMVDADLATQDDLDTYLLGRAATDAMYNTVYVQSYAPSVDNGQDKYVWVRDLQAFTALNRNVRAAVTRRNGNNVLLQSCNVFVHDREVFTIKTIDEFEEFRRLKARDVDLSTTTGIGYLSRLLWYSQTSDMGEAQRRTIQEKLDAVRPDLRTTFTFDPRVWVAKFEVEFRDPRQFIKPDVRVPAGAVNVDYPVLNNNIDIDAVYETSATVLASHAGNLQFNEVGRSYYYVVIDLVVRTREGNSEFKRIYSNDGLLSPENRQKLLKEGINKENLKNLFNTFPEIYTKDNSYMYTITLFAKFVPVFLEPEQLNPVFGILRQRRTIPAIPQHRFGGHLNRDKLWPGAVFYTPVFNLNVCAQMCLAYYELPDKDKKTIRNEAVHDSIPYKWIDHCDVLCRELDLPRHTAWTSNEFQIYSNKRKCEIILVSNSKEPHVMAVYVPQLDEQAYGEYWLNLLTTDESEEEVYNSSVSQVFLLVSVTDTDPIAHVDYISDYTSVLNDKTSVFCNLCKLHYTNSHNCSANLCNCCGTYFSTQAEYQMHRGYFKEKTYHERYTCDGCNASCFTRDCYEKHINGFVHTTDYYSRTKPIIRESNIANMRCTATKRIHKPCSATNSIKCIICQGFYVDKCRRPNHAAALFDWEHKRDHCFVGRNKKHYFCNICKAYNTYKHEHMIYPLRPRTMIVDKENKTETDSDWDCSKHTTCNNYVYAVNCATVVDVKKNADGTDVLDNRGNPIRFNSKRIVNIAVKRLVDPVRGETKSDYLTRALTDLSSTPASLYDSVLDFVDAFAEERCYMWAHNASRFDCPIIFYDLLTQDFIDKYGLLKPSNILGHKGKIIKMTVKLITFMDSYNHINLPLSQCISSVGIDEFMPLVKVSIFPHKFHVICSDGSAEDTTNYIGPFPSADFLELEYLCANQSEIDKERAIYETEKNKHNNVFNLKEQLSDHTLTNLNILALILGAYRLDNINYNNIDPLNSTTSSGYVYKLFRTYFQNIPIPLLSLEDNDIIRKSLQGGRTEVLQHYVNSELTQEEKMSYEEEGEEPPNKRIIRSYDINSSYPHVMLTCPMPVTHFNKIKGKWDDKVYGNSPVGFVNVDMFVPGEESPAAHRWLPVIGVKDENSKLIFGLCDQYDIWISIIEYNIAIKRGYQFTVHESWLSQGSTELFGEFVRHFYALKLKASGFIKGSQLYEDIMAYYKEDEDESLAMFLLDTETKYGIKIDAMDMLHEKNKGAYNMAKKCLLGLWGKLAQDKFPVFVVADAKKFNELSIRHLDNKITIETLEEVSNNPVLYLITYIDNTDSHRYASVNPAIASTITSHGRANLFSYIGDEEYAERVIYTDTDSLFIHGLPGDKFPDVSPHIGGLKCEIDNIKEGVFVSPKLYIVKYIKQGVVDYEMAAKGCELNLVNSKRVNFDNMKKLLFRNVPIKYNNFNILRCSDNRFRTVITTNQLFNNLEESKRTINNDKNFTTSPRTDIIPFKY